MEKAAAEGKEEVSPLPESPTKDEAPPVTGGLLI